MERTGWGASGAVGRSIEDAVSGQRQAAPGRGAAIDPSAAPGRGEGDAIHAAARQGIATPSGPLPFADRIQQAFGRHDLSGVRAHTGDEAAATAGAMGAEAYATGSDVVLGGAADLFTVAHEAAHVVQQRHGVHLLDDDVGSDGDPYEEHADAVAAAVVAGESAESLLDAGAGGHADADGDRDDDGDGGGDDDDDDVPPAAADLRADDGWLALAPALDAAMHETPEADHVDRGRLEQRVGRPPAIPPPDMSAAELRPLLARAIALFGAAPPAPADPDTTEPVRTATTTATPAVQMARGQRNKHALAGFRQHHRERKQQAKRDGRPPKKKSARAERREAQRRARAREASEVNWTGVLLLMLVISASAIDTHTTMQRELARMPPPDRPPPQPSSPTTTAPPVAVPANTTAPIATPNQEIAVPASGSGGVQFANLTTAELAERLQASYSVVFKLASKRLGRDVLPTERGFKFCSAKAAVNVDPYLTNCPSAECKALLEAWYVKTAVDNTLQAIWSGGHRVALVGETHDDASSIIAKTHLMCAAAPGARYIHFEEGITRALEHETRAVQDTCSPTATPESPQRVVRGVEDGLLLAVTGAAAMHDSFLNVDSVNSDSYEATVVTGMFGTSAVQPLLPKMLSAVGAAGKALLATLARGDKPATYVKADWVEVTGAMTRVLVEEAADAGLETDTITRFLAKPSDPALRRELNEESTLGARNRQWASVIGDTMTELDGCNAVVVLGDHHAPGLATLLGKELPVPQRGLIEDPAAKPAAKPSKKADKDEL